MRILTFVLIFMALGCAKGPTQDIESSGGCKAYVSPYEVEYPDASLRKSNISACPSYLKADALDQSGETETSGTLTIRLFDKLTGNPYFTTFDGQ